MPAGLLPNFWATLKIVTIVTSSWQHLEKKLGYFSFQHLVTLTEKCQLLISTVLGRQQCDHMARSFAQYLFGRLRQ